MSKTSDGIALKCVVIGDCGVGKTALLLSYTENILPTDEYVPAVYENRVEHVLVDGKVIRIALWDSSEVKDYSRLTPVVYPQTDVFLICFSLVSPDSYHHVFTKWLPEVQRHSPGTPIILAGTKLDLCDSETFMKFKDNKVFPITTEQALQMTKNINAEKYVECSALTQVGMKKVFDEVCRAYITKSYLKRSRKKEKYDKCYCMTNRYCALL